MKKKIYNVEKEKVESERNGEKSKRKKEKNKTQKSFSSLSEWLLI